MYVDVRVSLDKQNRTCLRVPCDVVVDRKDPRGHGPVIAPSAQVVDSRRWVGGGGLHGCADGRRDVAVNPINE